MGEGKFGKIDTFSKYQLLLAIAGCELFETDKEPLINVNLVRRLRNYLIHYNPEWIDELNDETWRLGKSLKGKYKTNSMVAADESFFPDKFLGYGCADWAICACYTFSEEFHRKIGLKPRYNTTLQHSGSAIELWNNFCNRSSRLKTPIL